MRPHRACKEPFLAEMPRFAVLTRSHQHANTHGVKGTNSRYVGPKYDRFPSNPASGRILGRTIVTISALAAAKQMGRHSDWCLSHLALQKLLYIAHMFHMGQNDGEPMVSGMFEAWDYGPVHPILYHEAKIFGADPVKDIFRSVREIERDDQKAQLLNEVVDELSNDTARLVAITHWERGAWARNYRPGARGLVIPNEHILEEYQARVDAYRQREQTNRPT